jgi:hypothetical protein
MCCAASGIERCVIVMVQLYCVVFTFVVFVGDGWMTLVPAHLRHLRLLRLEECYEVLDSYITEILAAVPQLVLINCEGDTVGGLRDKQLEAGCSAVAPDCDRDYGDLYDIIKQWKLDRNNRYLYISRCVSYPRVRRPTSLFTKFKLNVTNRFRRLL